ncbi:MAG TPA: Xaa-Pro peptidase family protein [Thermoanaerobaculia bacterium]|jgi:Xaa-Pro aminopeptidase|nr:Xaa-Pro peptidase family protein [Thermoanaerobaculia bacterium]
MRARLDALSASLAELGCEALLVLASSAQDTDLASFLPAPAHLGDCFLVLPRGGEPRLGFMTPMEREEAAATGLALLTPDNLDISRLSSELSEAAPFLARVVGKALDLCGLKPGRVALAGHGPAGRIQGTCALLAAEGWIWVPGNSLVFASRKRKEAPELAGIREAAAGTCEAMRAVAGLLFAASHDGAGSPLRLAGEPLTVARVRAEVARIFFARGLEQPRGNILAPAEEGAVPHNSGTPDRVLRAGESFVVDIFPRGRLFADCTRTFCVGEPPEALARGHDLVRSAVEEVHRRSVPGARGWDLQEMVCARFGEAGFPTPISHPGTTRGYVHNLGHGVGFDLHEFPTFKKASGGEGVLREGDVFTIEPGLYEPEAGWAVRIEDLVHLGPDGLESLTPLPYELDPAGWR